MGATADMMQADSLAKKSGNERYWLSKVGNWAHGVEYALRHKTDGVLSVPINPGNLQSDLYRDQGLGLKLAINLMLYPSVNGAYTALYAGLSSDITVENTGCWGESFQKVDPSVWNLCTFVFVLADCFFFFFFNISCPIWSNLSYQKAHGESYHS